MLPEYIYALGGTAKIKEFIDFVNQQEDVRNNITNKMKDGQAED